jgi:hypothetical protein
MNTAAEELNRKYNQRKKTHLIISVIVDLLGMASYLIPILGELTDIIYAPISGMAIFLMYKQNPTAGILGGLFGASEELFVGDFIPTATLMWIYTYKLNNEKTLKTLIEDNKPKALK